MPRSLQSYDAPSPPETALRLAPFVERGIVERLLGGIARVLLRVYRLSISPLLGANCRFEPSCSRYAEQAIEHHGPLRGGIMGLRRLLRCHPWGGAGGFDPVS
ncbi:MAG TPA: membrane protein insertion efficiency factor YidD [Candidatus Binatia bacterium]|nr:membrane protein insertion efficiency factor YidD [Candidatus Binatia bacterium]